MALQASDLETLREYHQFVRDDELDAEVVDQDWRARMARRYYDLLYKEFAIVDLSRHEEGQIGLRWRIKEEVLAGRGQFSCGAKRCEAAAGLQTYEVPFQYHEQGEEKMELVKVRLCKDCSEKLLSYRKALKKRSKRSIEAAESKDPKEDNKKHKKMKHQDT